MSRAAGNFTAVTELQLLEFVRSQRWFDARGRAVVESAVLDQVELAAPPESLLSFLLEIRFSGGAHEIYQLLARPGAAAGVEGTLDALAEPSAIARLLELASESASVPSGSGAVEFSSFGRLPAATDAVALGVHPLGVAQSNSSVVVDDELIIKLYRRLEPGVNPELELLQFFARAGFAHVPELRGWWGYSGDRITATLGFAQHFLPGARDGWALGLSTLPTTPERFLAMLDTLGEVIGSMHTVLASDSDDPAFAPEDASPHTLALLAATIDEQIGQLFDRLPNDDRVAPITGRGDALRQLLGNLTVAGSAGRLIRNHGDLHLGQVLRAADTWYVVDFEGELTRSLHERRAKHSPLRDVAAMLRSFSYLAAVTGHADDGTEARARELFLEGYLSAAQGAGILPSSPYLERLIGIFELEKAVSELRYELDHRPDWVYIPVAGLERLLERLAA